MSLRPDRLCDIIGQKQTVERLKISIDSANHKGHTLPHILFYGASGCGKTTIAMAVANEIGSTLYTINGGNVTSIKSCLASVIKIQERDVLFIDEVHRVPVRVSEWFYTIMEDFRMDIGSDDRLSIDLPKFTMLGATTEAGSLSRPFYDRFTYKFQLKLYGVDDLADIVIKTAETFDLACGKDVAANIARRSRGTPRVVISLMKWVRDYALSKGSVTLSETLVEDATRMIGVSQDGSTDQDRAYLEVLRVSGRPMGLRTLVDATNLDADTIQNVVEPFLLRKQLIYRTPKGRVLV